MWLVAPNSGRQNSFAARRSFSQEVSGEKIALYPGMFYERKLEQMQLIVRFFNKVITEIT